MLKQILQKYIEQPVKVTVYNSKSRKMRGTMFGHVGMAQFIIQM